MENKTLLIIAIGLIALLLYTSQTKDTPTDDLSVSTPKNITPKNTTNTTIVKLNKCGYANYGYPDYAGTEKENMTCKDAWPDQQNLECILSPPVKYDGIIIAINKTSNPALTCCVGDGTCQWVPKSK